MKQVLSKNETSQKVVSLLLQELVLILLVVQLESVVSLASLSNNLFSSLTSLINSVGIILSGISGSLTLSVLSV
jgi:hypothetical protein